MDELIDKGIQLFHKLIPIGKNAFAFADAEMKNIAKITVNVFRVQYNIFFTSP